MKKKLLAMFLVVVMVGSLVACGKKSDDHSDSQPTSTTGEKSTDTTKDTETKESGDDAAQSKDESKYPIVEEPITITGLIVGGDTSISKSRLVWDKASEISGINIEWKIIDSDALGTYLAGGEWPDFFHCNLSTEMINDYGILGGRFVNYLDHLDLMPNLVKCFEDYPHTLAISTQSNGEMYNLFKVTGRASTAVMARPHVRRDVLEDAGINELPTTVDELYDQLVTLKEKNGEPGMILGREDQTDWAPMLFAAFGTLKTLDFDDDGTGKVVFTRTSDQMKHYYEYLHKLYEEELMNREWLTMDATVMNELCTSGKVAYIPRHQAQALTTEVLKNGDWSYLDCVAPLTSQYDSTQEIWGYIDYASSGFFMNAESEYVEEMCQLFDMMYATEEVEEGSGLYGHSFVYGLENVDWVINDDGTYEQIAPESYNGAFTTYQYGELIWMNSGRADKFGEAITSTPGNAQARQISFVKNVIPYQSDLVFPIWYLQFTDDETYVLENKLSEIQSYYKQMEAQFIMGEADLENDWDAYVEQCEKMGIQDILDVYQAAYERWNESIAKIINK